MEDPESGAMAHREQGVAMWNFQQSLKQHRTIEIGEHGRANGDYVLFSAVRFLDGYGLNGFLFQYRKLTRTYCYEREPRIKASYSIS